MKKVKKLKVQRIILFPRYHLGLFINGFFSDSNSFKDAEILDYMNYELVGYSSYDYIELFDVNEFEINFNQLNSITLN